MIEHFIKLPAAERQNLINVCLDEFGEKGYERASTNVIVTNARIPKGTLFYFFKNKKNLFLFLLDHAVGEYVAYIESQSAALPSDLFERLLYLSSVRLRFAAHAPRVYKFFFKTLLNIPDGLKVDLKGRFQQYAEENQKLMRDGLDTSRLRIDVSVEQVLGLLNIFMEGLLAGHTEQLAKMDAGETILYVEKMLEESKKYFHLIKHGVYADQND
jgi:TetR/AcrR family transcriptional regulator